MQTDQLSALLERFNLQAGVFHNGSLCGIVGFGEEGDESGHVHLLRAGTMRVRLADGSAREVTAPTLLCYPRALPHRFEIAPGSEVELTCASVRFQGGANNPIAQAMPATLVLGIHELDNAGPLLNWLFAEAFENVDGRMAVLNRLFELLMIQLLRYLIQQGKAESGLIAGLADTRIALALDALHSHPESAWTIESLAAKAGMSRARFAAHFRAVLGLAPIDYLTNWRLALAQQKLKAGDPIKQIANEVGYENPSALARAFRRKLGCSPGEWLREQRVSDKG